MTQEHHNGTVISSAPDEVTIISAAHPRTPEELKRGERIVAAFFTLSAIAALGFCATFVFGDEHLRYYTPCLGGCLGLAFSFFGIGLVLWVKKLMPHEIVVQERHTLAHSAEDRADAGKDMAFALNESGLLKHRLLRRSLLGAGGALGLIAIFPLRSLGKAPGTSLLHTAWRKGTRMVTLQGNLVKLGDIEIGGQATVFPEFNPDTDEIPFSSQTLLIRLRPGEDKPRKGRENWTLDGHVAYSKLCTHAGCPVSLYEQQTHHLLCPCHQSTFDVTDGCRPLFGPAARSLPQLAIAVDADGYFIAQGDYSEPVGPSFWERKP